MVTKVGLSPFKKVDFICFKVKFEIYVTINILQQTVTINKLPGISRSKGNKVMKVGQLIKYSVRNIFFKNHAENEAAKLVLDLFLFFKKALYEVKYGA